MFIRSPIFRTEDGDIHGVYGFLWDKEGELVQLGLEGSENIVINILPNNLKNDYILGEHDREVEQVFADDSIKEKIPKDITKKILEKIDTQFFGGTVKQPKVKTVKGTFPVIEIIYTKLGNIGYIKYLNDKDKLIRIVKDKNLTIAEYEQLLENLIFLED